MSDDRGEIRIRLDADAKRRIKAMAEADGNSVAAFVRAATMRELVRREKEDAARSS